MFSMYLSTIVFLFPCEWSILLFRTNAIEFDHFEVMRTSGGYKLNIENEVGCKMEK